MSDMQSFNLDGKVAVVTGALGLLGREHCLALAAAGAKVVATDLDAEGCAEFAESLVRFHRTPALGVAADVTDPDSVEALAERVLGSFGQVDVLVNNAAIDDKFASDAADESRFESYSVERFRRMLDVNVLGTFLCAQRLGRRMAARGSGSIINIASTYGVVAPQQALYRRADGSQSFFKSPAYPTSKGAVLQFTRFLAAYWGNAGVRVNALSPGGVAQDPDPEFRRQYAARTPLGRMAEPSDYRGALVFLASGASAYMTGANLIVDGGWTTW
ncbi:MAG TPA: SDR family oxidoreductase [Polyangiaceae bacterium]|jgi:NAD(P)-dependent dehydrogenase (short-subunit alcohol dehydrogenase family)|nr:SDR family oxidoreductase [Polyangiaceae bacterium]